MRFSSPCKLIERDAREPWCAQRTHRAHATPINNEVAARKGRSWANNRSELFVS